MTLDDNLRQRRFVGLTCQPRSSQDIPGDERSARPWNRCVAFSLFQSLSPMVESTRDEEDLTVPEESYTPAAAGLFGRISGYVADGLRYWEPRRLLYNAALAAVVGAHVVTKWTAIQPRLSFDMLFGFFFLAVLANVCYCVVYAVDLFVRFSGLQEAWERARVVVLLVGTAFAAVITHFFSSVILWGI